MSNKSQKVKKSPLQNSLSPTIQNSKKKDKSKTVLRYFNTIARRYDVMNTLLSFGLHHLWKRAAVRMAGLQHGDAVLDLCGGTADLAILAARSVGAKGKAVVYDFSIDMMQAGLSKIEKTSRASALRHVCGDAGSIAAHDSTFDAVLIGFGLRNLPDREQGLQEMHRVLKPGGRLICLEFSRPTFIFLRWFYDMYSFYAIPLAGKIIGGSMDAYTYLPQSIRSFPLPDDLSAIINKAGFSDVTYRRLTNGIAVIHAGIKKKPRRCFNKGNLNGF
jgi:demethylmenaquinone methyltransferase/2-methoxy-6-polyprenyl-1,4-benzoquinol methylase